MWSLERHPSDQLLVSEWIYARINTGIYFIWQFYKAVYMSSSQMCLEPKGRIGGTCHRNRSVPKMFLEPHLDQVPLYPGLLVRSVVVQGGTGVWGTEGPALPMPLCSEKKP